MRLFSSLEQFSLIASFRIFLEKIHGVSRNFFNYIYIYIIEIMNSEIYLPEVSVSSTMGIKHQCRRIKHRCRRGERRCVCIERQYRHIEWQVFHDVSQCFKCFMTTVEETLISGKYVSLFLISILYIYKI